MTKCRFRADSIPEIDANLLLSVVACSCGAEAAVPEPDLGVVVPGVRRLPGLLLQPLRLHSHASPDADDCARCGAIHQQSH
jgi:hypothetical protein